jgi:hypothetical protein
MREEVEGRLRGERSMEVAPTRSWVKWIPKEFSFVNNMNLC